MQHVSKAVCKKLISQNPEVQDHLHQRSFGTFGNWKPDLRWHILPAMEAEDVAAVLPEATCNEH
eukprot:2081143-Amphidinium_carterae.1